MAENKPKEIRQSEILEAALQVFVKKGYDASRMDDIVERSGLSKGALYHHYNSKRDLFLSLIDHWEAHVFPDLSLKRDPKSASDSLRGIMTEMSNIFKTRKHVFLAELEFWAMSNRDEEIRNRTRKLYENILNLFEGIIQRGLNDGEFTGIDPQISALAVMTTLQGVIWFSIFEHQKFDADEYLRAVMGFMIKGFTGGKAV